MDDDKYFKGPWAIVMSGGKQYLGKICVREDVTLEELKAALMDRSGWVQLSPVFDYAVPMQLGPSGVQKIPAPTPFDMTHEDCKVFLQVTGIAFFEDMQAGDKKRYKEMVAATRDERDKARMIKTSGLVLPTNPVKRG